MKERIAAHMEVCDFKVSGCLNQGFQGHITYTIAVPDMDQGLEISFSFNKREALQNLDMLKEECRKALACNVPGRELSEEECSAIYRMPKTEINVSVFHNGYCIGTAHRNAMIKNIKITPDGSSEGFVPYRITQGIVKIVLHVLNVLNDGTNYELAVKGGSHEV